MSLDLSKLTDDQLRELYQQQQSVHQIESGGASDARADIVNPASGARGSMQVMNDTARDPGFGVKPSNGTPQDDARMGRDYYAALSQKYDNDPLKTAVAYNWGPGNADKWIANGAKMSDLPDETLKYLSKHGQNIGLGNAPAAAPQPAQTLPQPTKTEMNIVEEAPADTPDYTFGGRLAKGAMDTLGGAARAGAAGLEWLLNKTGDTKTAADIGDLRQQAEEAQAARDREFALKRQLAGGTGTDWVQVGGKMIPAFLIPGGGARSLLGAAAEGAAGGAVLGAADTPPGESYLENAGKGAAFGGAGGAAVNALGKILRGATLSPNAQKLADEGVNLTPGQALGGQVRNIEEKATSWPIVGELVKDAKRGAITDMNDALYRRVLDPIGESIPKSTPVREAVEQMGNKISQAYDNLLPNLSFAPDAAYNQGMLNVLTQQARLPRQLRNEFNNIMDDNILNFTNQNGALTGDALKAAESALGKEADRYAKSTMPNDQRMSEILKDVRTLVRQGIERQNPQYAGQLQSINQAYANLSTVRNAAARVTNPENPIMPGQLQNAIRQSRGSKNAFAAGNKRLQDLGDPAAAVLGQSVPDSGTAGRLMMGAGILGGTGLPLLLHNPAIAAGVGAMAAGYGTNVGRKAMFALLAKRPDLIRSLGMGVEAASPYAGVLAGALPSPERR